MSSSTVPSTILVVDDNPVNLRLLFEYLGREGFRVLVCEDGETAVEQARETLPDLILMDVLLPGMSGYDSCRAIHAQTETADIPVIFLTALSRTSDKIEGFTAGGVDYLIKPLQFEEVLARVATHLSLRTLRKELEQQNRELARRDRRREQLFGILAHDLRSPVAACVSAVRLLKGSADEEIRAEALEVLDQRIGRLDRQLSDLLAWGEVQISGGLKRSTWFDLAALLEELRSEVQEQLERKGIAAAIECSAPCSVYQDQTAIRTIVTNFLANALKYTEAGGAIRMEAATNGSTGRVTVRDTGVGMTSSQLQQLLERSDRVQTAGTRGERGTGLGLLLSLEIAELIDGAIEATSEPGAGSSFTVTFPCVPPDPDS